MDGNKLPDDVALYIASKLQVPDVCVLGATSKFWREVCSSNFVWLALSKERWPGVENLVDYVGQSGKSIEEGEDAHINVFPGQEWRHFYIRRSLSMADAALNLVKFIKQSSNAESIEVGDYERAMQLLRTSKMIFSDVELHLLKPKHSVLVNLIALHYCLSCLGINDEDLKKALHKNQISDRNICLRWWVLGQWVNGFRRGDEMNVCIASLIELLDPRKQNLYVIDRGRVHEVLRVQISADFRTSAWIAREMHSQR